jgi:hypothetical protein
MKIADVDAMPVHIVGAEKGVVTPLTPKAGKRFRTTYETYPLTVNDPVQNILPQDPKRFRYSIIALDNDIVLGPTKGVAGSAVNTVTSVPAPNGAYFPKGIWRDFYDNGMVYAGITTAVLSRVVVVAEYYE